MKGFVVGLLLFFLLGFGGFFVYQKFFSKPATPTTSFQTTATTKVGVLQKATSASSDYSHILLSEGKSVGVAGPSVNLDSYVGKKVEIIGQYSGTTLYVDTVKLSP
ncbi:hypothetical protein A2973_01375 [Candidatus Gottesmanbacteria bacterium RIFCSPLOWO2_01_FULL_49_10]|uniref:Uncharacterized protein n=1 Tax=Candidatus Gottesmanbacteria bacterium RIFCSPLOWO2_01_FULL_49_10 TaxID=1798396 RepID=A0A1F6AW74_9BACT|nr:MAG: hypothetical protein A2973_01375 [Candidatus Gottesmanbacteria bacterium RIFCSPLOWO2_01_FULL_49_10]